MKTWTIHTLVKTNIIPADKTEIGNSLSNVQTQDK